MDNASTPLAPAVPALAVCNTMVPDVVTLEYPVPITTAPPVAAELVPAERRISPPEPLWVCVWGVGVWWVG